MACSKLNCRSRKVLRSRKHLKLHFIRLSEYKTSARSIRTKLCESDRSASATALHSDGHTYEDQTRLRSQGRRGMAMRTSPHR